MKRIVWSKSNETVDFPFVGGTACLKYNSGAANAVMTVSLPYNAAFGAGERFDSVNLKGHFIKNVIEEKFCYQGNKTYCPIPFFLTDSGFGMFVDTGAVTSFLFNDSIEITMPVDSMTVLFSGTPKSIISEFINYCGPAKLPPKWAFLPWISANHWNTQEKAEHQIALLKEHDFPAGVIVLEAWSDESTFYIFNGAQYTPKENGVFDYSDFTFPEEGPWPDPKGMIDKIHDAGLHVVLWQIPVYKKLSSDQATNPQHDIDCKLAKYKSLCVMGTDGTPYIIPDGNWFGGSMIPDFTNPDTRRDWFSKRQYLIDMGVDGFKTDGGEFIYRDDLLFKDGSDGKTMKNLYAKSYTDAYTDFLPNDKVLFSRAGYSGQHTTPILWAGDQQSTFEELRSQLKAGLSASMSGIIFWGFDIGGFAGPLPSPELYLRATQLACFSPVMQWHSEPDGGQFKDIMETHLNNNERSPWNISKLSSDDEFLNKIRFYHKLRESLLPYIHSQAQECVSKGKPLIYPFSYLWPHDDKTHKIDDQFMFGDKYMLAPILHEGEIGRKVYLPEGVWTEHFTGNTYEGKQSVFFEHPWHMPIYIKCK